MTKADSDSVVALYDLGYHLVDTIAEDALEAELASLKKIISSNGGEVVFERNPHNFALAYPITRMRKGAKDVFFSSYFGTLVFEVTRDAVGAIEKALRANPSMLRFMLIETSRAAGEEAVKIVIKEEEKAKKVVDEAAAVDEAIEKTVEALAV